MTQASITQPVNGKNHLAVIQLRLLGFPLVNIRKSLHKLTGITQPEMARTIGMSRQTVTMTVQSNRSKPEVQQKIADVFGIPVNELFAE